MQQSTKPLLVFIPTYNERENVPLLYEHVKKNAPYADILFCDDNSPDGTGKLIKELTKKDPCVFGMYRPSKMGLGTAHIQAFLFAKEKNYDFLITMDADFTHDPAYIPQLFEQRIHADVVIGSRYIDGARMIGWNRIRLPLTHFWRGMIRYGLGLPYDCTGAFRLYNVHKLEPAVYKRLNSRGFSFCMESLYRLHEHSLVIKEIPIEAHTRKHGKSKLSGSVMSEVAMMLFKLSVEKRGFFKS